MVDKLKWYSLFVFLFGAIVGFADPITDILTLVEFYRADHKTWFGVRLAFIILSCFLYPAAYCFRFSGENSLLTDKLREALLCGLNPFSAAISRLNCFIFSVQNFKKIRRGEKLEFRDETVYLFYSSEVALLFEATFESAPQFIIQLYAMSVQQEPVRIIQMIALPVSFLSLAWAATVADIVLPFIDVPNWKNKLYCSF